MRLLILAYDFPPNTSVGAQRPYGWFKYLKQHGIDPVVVTRHWDEVRTPKDTIRPCGSDITVTETEEGTIIRVPYHPNLRDRMLLRFGDRLSLVRKMLSLWFMLGQYFVKWADNRRNILDAARAHLILHPVDAIIATGEPFVLFSYASQLSAEFNVPWVGDYRDGWSNNYLMESDGPFIDRIVNKLFTEPLERSLTRTSAALTAATPVLANELTVKLKPLTVSSILNGYFEEAFQNLPQFGNASSAFTIVYSGSLYAFQPVETFLAGIEILISREALSPEHLRVVFIGMDFQGDAKERIARFSETLKPFIGTTPRCSHAETIQILLNSDLMLVLAGGPFQPIPAKLYDYIAIGGPVMLCTGDNGPVEAILADIGNGIVVNDEKEVCEAVWNLMQSDREVNKPNADSLIKYSRRHQAGILAGLLKDITTK